MERAPTVSVLMPAHNAEEYMPLAIDSVLNQTFGDFEFIIVEDPSTDRTHEVIAKYAEGNPRIVPVINNEKIGLTASLNKGLEMARGEFVARMDADDISHPERLKKQVDYIRANPDVCMIATSRERIDENGKTISSYSMDGGKEKLREMMKVTCSVAHGSVMYRRKEVIELGKYRDGILYAEDYDLWLRMMEKHNIDVLPEILYKFRLTKESRSVASSAEDKYYHNLVRRFARERELYGKDSYDQYVARDVAEETSEQRRAEMYHLYRGLEYLSSDFRKEARREFWGCVKLRPMRPLYWLLSATSTLPLRILNWMRWVWRKAPRDVH